MVSYEMKEKDNNMTLIEHDDEAWVVLDEGKVDFEDLDDDKADLK